MSDADDRSLPKTTLRSHARVLIARTISGAFESIRQIPPGTWFQRRLRRSLEFTSTDIPLPNAGAGLHDLEIVFLSDLHAGFYTTKEDLGHLTDRIAALHPDLICIGGDLIATRRKQIELLDRLLGELDPPLGKFAVPGNHEVFYFDCFPDAEATRQGVVVDLTHDVPPREQPIEALSGWREYLEIRGVRVLENKGVRLEKNGASFWLAGVDDLEEGNPRLDAALAGRHEGEPTLLLSHHPDFFVDAAEHVDIQLSGHTHGGQIRVFGVAPITHSKHRYVAGRYERDGAHMYVGRGVGVSLAPFRFGARAEVATVRLKTR